jgi:hypothetical protein
MAATRQSDCDVITLCNAASYGKNKCHQSETPCTSAAPINRNVLLAMQPRRTATGAQAIDLSQAYQRLLDSVWAESATRDAVACAPDSARTALNLGSVPRLTHSFPRSAGAFGTQTRTET